MTYSIDELYDAFYRQYQIKADGGGYAYIEQYIKESEGINSALHKFILSGGHDPIIISCPDIVYIRSYWGKEELIKSTAEDQQMKPAEIIKQEKQVLEQVIKDACNKFVDATGVDIRNIDIKLISVNESGWPQKMIIDRVSVYYANI